MPKLARFDVQYQWPVSHALDFFHVMLDLLEHPANLPVASFHHRNLVPGIGGIAHQLDSYRRGLYRCGLPLPACFWHTVRRGLERLTFRREHDACAQFVDLFLGGLVSDLDQV